MIKTVKLKHQNIVMAYYVPGPDTPRKTHKKSLLKLIKKAINSTWRLIKC